MIDKIHKCNWNRQSLLYISGAVLTWEQNFPHNIKSSRTLLQWRHFVKWWIATFDSRFVCRHIPLEWYYFFGFSFNFKLLDDPILHLTSLLSVRLVSFDRLLHLGMKQNISLPLKERGCSDLATFILIVDKFRYHRLLSLDHLLLAVFTNLLFLGFLLLLHSCVETSKRW